MGKIHVLDFSVANLIAAGEVVDRPASAIKELIENSIDAEATTITVEIRGGGSAFMRVTDNGCGMEHDDVPMCIRRHATSKIRTGDDLLQLLSYGFRGEALAALASVASMRIMTRRPQDEMGTLFTCSEGKTGEFCPIGCPVGTTIIAERLFENVPVRRGFLKKDITESAAVVTVTERMALSHPEISFRLIVDGELRFTTAGDGRLLNTIYALYGKSFAQKMIPVEDLTDFIETKGFVGRPDAARGNRNMEIVYVNGRCVRSPIIVSALEQAFVSYCPAEKFPVCVLFVTVPAPFVDVNVHPAKQEVKFSGSAKVFDAVYCAVRNALNRNLTRPGAEGVEKLWLTGSDVRKQGIAPQIPEDLKPASSPEEAQKQARENENAKARYEQIGIADLTPALKEEKKKTPPAPTRPEPIPEAAPGPIRPEAAITAGAESDPYPDSIPFPTDADAPAPRGQGCDFGGWSFSESEFAPPPAPTEEKHDPIPVLHEEKPDFRLGRIGKFGGVYDAHPEWKDLTREDRAGAYDLSDLCPKDAAKGGYDRLIPYCGRDGVPTPAQTLLSEPAPQMADERPVIPWKVSEWNAAKEPKETSAPPEQPRDLPFYRIAGVLFNCYVIVELSDKMLMIDKHAAHERILFEKKKREAEQGTIVPQMLLVPLTPSLNAQEISAALEYREELAKLGYGMICGKKKDRLTLSEIPLGIPADQALENFESLVGALSDGSITPEVSRRTLYEKALFQASCKAAVKAGRDDSPETIEYIVRLVLSSPEIRFCPHGRPVAFEMTKQQVEHLFKRP